MKFYLLIITGLLLSFNGPIQAEVGPVNENMVKFKSDRFFGSGLQRVLIIPQINLYIGEKILMGSGVGVIAGKEIGEFEDQFPSILEPVEPMLNSTYYNIYTLYKNKEFEEINHILLCEIEGENVNLIIKDRTELIYLRLPDKFSKLIISNIIKKQFSFPPIK